MTFRDLQRVVQDLRSLNVHPMTEVRVTDPTTHSKFDLAGCFFDNGQVSMVLDYSHAPVTAEAMEERE